MSLLNRPLRFEPFLRPMVWGGRRLESLGKHLPDDRPYGESWEISDRPGDQSMVANGPLEGKTLHWLLEQNPTSVLFCVT